MQDTQMWTTGPRCGPQYQEGMWQTQMWTTGPRYGPQDQEGMWQTYMWTTGPTHGNRTYIYMWTTPTGCMSCYMPTLNKTSLVDHFIGTGGPLYISTLNKTRSCKPPHNSDMLCGLLQNNTEQDQDMWTTLQGHVDHLTTGTSNVDCNIPSLNKTWTCGPPYKDMQTAISQLKKTPNRHKPQDKYVYTNMACHTRVSGQLYKLMHTNRTYRDANVDHKTITSQHLSTYNKDASIDDLTKHTIIIFCISNSKDM